MPNKGVPILIRHVDPAVKKRFQAQAAREGRPMSWVLLRLMELYGKVGLAKLEEAAK